MEPFKAIFSPGLVAMIGARVAERDPGFDREGFEALANDRLEALELKARAAQITRALDAFLPPDLDRAREILLAALHPEADEAAGSDERGLRGWAVMPLAEWVALRGLHDFDRSMAALEAMTRRFSAEFAVRPFILADPERALVWLSGWAESGDAAVRRLASEGSRPRLPWGIRLAPFVADPSPLVPILTRLRDDPSETVRRSVANNLNDIAKDHPDLVAALARQWLADAPPGRVRLVRHALRTLVKQGNPDALAALGYGAANVEADLEVLTPRVDFGAAVGFVLDLFERSGRDQRLVIDYAIHHRRANGGTSPKVFKWRTLELSAGGAASLERRHPIRAITTRRYYDGAHRVEILVNGSVVAGGDFELVGATCES